MAHKLPWDDLSTQVIPAHEVKPRKQWVKAGGWILAALLLITGIARRNYIGLFFAVIIALALVSRKSVAVTERGLETFMDMQFLSNYELWKWEEIEALTHEKVAQFPGTLQLYFTRGDRTRRVFFLEKDGRQVLALAKKKNSKTKIYDGNAYIEKHAKHNSERKGKA